MRRLVQLSLGLVLAVVLLAAATRARCSGRSRASTVSLVAIPTGTCLAVPFLILGLTRG